ncbi:MAG: helix-turn-helix transcriptional regulator [Bacteroidaceae bacterium]|nr:helix-turn-helix transcriptional regulator [Bacteroidaceae bacterium]
MQSFYYNYVHLEPSEQIGLHEQPNWELSYIVTGSGQRLIGTRTEAFESGEVVLIPPNVPHCWYFDSKQIDNRGRIANICILFESEQLQRIAEAFPALREQLDSLCNDPTSRVFTRRQAGRIAEVMVRMNEESETERSVSLLQLLILITEDKGVSQQVSFAKMDSTQIRINQIHTYIICNMQRTVLLENLAAHVGMNRSSLCIFMKKHLGMTFSEYLNHYRIEYACRLLADKSLPVKDVSYKSGYSDAAYFNRIFSKLKGCPPRAYRKGLDSSSHLSVNEDE